jgi:hypothetical protein
MLHTPLTSLQRAHQRLVADVRFGPPWLCKTGLWPEAAPTAAVLKLLKQHWSPDPHDKIASTCGIFFSVWVDDSAIAAGGLHYNLHALKLRHLAGYRLESRKFAAAFREVFLPTSNTWPNVETEFGPQTLFQGFAKCPADRIEETTLNLAIKFAPLGDVIDGLLSNAAHGLPQDLEDSR